MSETNDSQTTTLLLMGSKAFTAGKLPDEITARLNTAMKQNLHILVGEAPGANQAFQDYLAAHNYHNVTVGHARSIRYNAGDWKTQQFGDNVREREKNMIAACDVAIIIWVNHSSVIATNLERLKESDKPTFIYEYDQSTGAVQTGMIDPKRIYDPNYQRYKYFKRRSTK